ncbi:Jag N-terminal domain-containing protein [SCandidatus Aminicenantes bacterium Aminicenantia_JdfR_composite]|jgi:spoIIIJ-associated protein|nr:Jag N-terminal domain-containing protein [SCandidatus Aminicenantes bacterium Aminicenantia_JdfR_composite]MCP2597579.1 Jag N-terminal domain-containing protein [Candidatus Aminicenantes bacterium AC-335-G13]MCP2597808.1 Jag N-terminal domain-containing protein [Candidatus Aminicenantes bacterium AC-335-L06]MCP2620533.1 Jag N-terminal domain-containing protein [Candidatus Aminicenantes bacterium AC-334-E05]
MEEKRKENSQAALEFKGRNLEEAIKSAERHFKQHRSNLEYRVVAEKTRLMGAKKKEVVIQAWIRSNQSFPELREFLNNFLRIFPLKLEFYLRERETTIDVIFNGQDRFFLLRKEASLLNAIQHVLNKVFSSLPKRIQCDCNNYRKKRERKIISLAEKAAEKVVQTGEKEVLGLMNPYERRIVHLRINQIPGVSSESIGDGFYKRVVIFSISSRENQ